MSSPPDARPVPVSFMDRVREKERTRRVTAKTDETQPAAPVGVCTRAAPPTAKTDETTIAPAFAPGPPYFEQIGPNAWRETAWALARCVLCPDMLAAGDRIYCADHRRAGEGMHP